MIFVVDVGTSVLKAAVFGPDGTLDQREESELTLVKSNNPLYHEVDANSWIEALSLLSEKLDIRGNRNIEAVVVSGNGPTLVPVGADDKPLDLAMTWMDRRGIAEAEHITELNGFYVDPTFYLPKALWIYNNRPAVYEATKYFFSCSEYINYLLTGVAKTVLPVPEYRPYIWTEELVTSLGMDWGKFPDFIRPAEMVGEVAAQGEQLCGIPQGVPVFAGGADFIVSLLGTGVVFPGRVCDRSGTSEGINLCSDRLIHEERLLCVSHVIEGMYNISGIISTSGKALEWFKNISGNKHTSYEELFHHIEDVPAGSDNLIFLPYLTGERAPIWDPNARGTFVGLTLNHGRKEMTRAVVESVGYAIRDIIEIMEENQLEVEELRITGSQAKSALWNQIKADITGKKIIVPELKDSELAGNMSIALYGLGKYSSLAEAADKNVRIEKTYHPDEKQGDLYSTYFRIYRKTYQGLKDVYKDLTHIHKSQEEHT
jgi:xylulokinase